MKWILITLLAFVCLHPAAQNVPSLLDAAVKKLEADTQCKHAIISLYVVDSKTGAVIFDQHAQTGLAPASCQKVITSVSAFEMLGKNYRYKTEMAMVGRIAGNELIGDLYIIGYGDPSLGSWRWPYTNDTAVLNRMLRTVKAKGITQMSGSVVCFDANWESNTVPRGWIWEDIGNYYGAGASGVNWMENQYKIILSSDNTIGTAVKFKNTYPKLHDIGFELEAKAGEKNSGDNAYVYLAPYSGKAFIRGTIPAGVDSFTISGSIHNPGHQLAWALAETLRNNNIVVPYSTSFNELALNKSEFPKKEVTSLYTIQSPPLDSINYWFLKKSVNLYGEAFVKTIAFEKIKFGSTDTGIAIIKNFWKQKGIEPAALNIIDGSGLSPANRVTTNALVTVMQYAKQQPWFPSFYYALPEINGIKMKDGYISGVRSYTGYIKSKSGNEYTFSFIINNFDGSAGTIREKMWKLLDILK